MNNKYDYIGNRIRSLRVLRKFSQEELGKKLGLPKQSISRIEKGNRKVTDSELEMIAEFLGVTTKYLLEDGWIERLYKKPHEPTNKWGLKIPPNIEIYLEEEEENFDYLIDSEQISYAEDTIKELENIIKAFELFLQECKEKLKKYQKQQ